VGMTVDVVRSRARVPMTKARDLLLGLSELNGDEDVDVPIGELAKEIQKYLLNYGLDSNVIRTKGKSFIDIDFVSEKWYDMILDAFEVISKFTEGESYFVFHDAGEMWRYVLSDGEVVEQSVACFIWTVDVGTVLSDMGIDVNIDIVSDREKLKAAL